MSNYTHGDRVELAKALPGSLDIGDMGTVTHLNGDGQPGTSSYWTNLDGNRGVWVEWDHASDETGMAFWAPTDALQSAS